VTVELPERPGENWIKVKQVGTKNYSLTSLRPVYEKKQKEVTVGYTLTNQTTEVT